MFSCESCEISENTFFYRTPPVAAFGLQNVKMIYIPVRSFIQIKKASSFYFIQVTV